MSCLPESWPKANYLPGSIMRDGTSFVVVIAVAVVVVVTVAAAIC